MGIDPLTKDRDALRVLGENKHASASPHAAKSRAVTLFRQGLIVAINVIADFPLVTVRKLTYNQPTSGSVGSGNRVLRRSAGGNDSRSPLG